MADNVRWIPNDVGIYGMTAPGGIVWKYAFQRARSVERLGKVYAPKRTGRLARTVKAKKEVAPPGHTIMTVWAETPYAASVHEGARPHLIGPRFPGNRLVFVWDKSPKGVFVGRPGQQVSHPGQSAQPFLATALREVMSRL